MKVYSIKKERRDDDSRRSMEFFVLDGKETVNLMLLLQKDGYIKKEERNALYFERNEDGTDCTISWTIRQNTLPTAQEAVEKKVSSIICF